MPGPVGILTLAFFLVVIPYGAYKSRAKLTDLVAMPRVPFFRNIVVQQLFFASIAMVAVVVEQVRVELGRVNLPLVAVAVVVVALFVRGMQPRWREGVAKRDPRTLFIAPRTRRERAWWIAVSVAAGVSEEFVWRGVVAGLLWWISGEWWIAAVVTSLAFGVSHSIQGWKSAAIIAVAAFAMQAYVRWADGLLLAMAVHAGYDIVAGLSYGRLCDEAGLPLVPEGPPVTPEAAAS